MLAVESREIVGCSKADVDPERDRPPVGVGWPDGPASAAVPVTVPVRRELEGKRNDPGAKGRVKRSLNPVAVRCRAPGLGAGTWGRWGASGSRADIASRYVGASPHPWFWRLVTEVDEMSLSVSEVRVSWPMVMDGGEREGDWEGERMVIGTDVPGLSPRSASLSLPSSSSSSKASPSSDIL